MSSNLPPGCSSPDGGIDHAFEAAIDDLCQSFESIECVTILTAMAPIIEEYVCRIRIEAYQEGAAETRQLIEAQLER